MNKDNIDISKIDTVILAGGLGTRLRSVIKDKPKCLAPINGKPFIDILLDDCINQGLRRFILCVGYLKEQVIEHLNQRNDCEIVFSVENTPLGTGGALKNAEIYIKSDPFLVMNGDTLNYFNINDFFRFHRLKKSFLSIVLANKKIQNDYGSVAIDQNSKIIGFIEKNKRNKNRVVNAGIYMFNMNIIKNIKSISSLEKDFLPFVINEIDCFGYKIKKPFVDIGTGNTYYLANKDMIV